MRLPGWPSARVTRTLKKGVMIMILYSVEVEHMDTPYELSQGNIL